MLILDAKVVLRPEKLARRRWFSRKYPICIIIPNSDQDTKYNSPAMEVATAESCPNLAFKGEKATNGKKALFDI